MCAVVCGYWCGMCVVCEGAAMANLGHQASHATQIFIFSQASHNLLINHFQGTGERQTIQPGPGQFPGDFA